jgi:hypothetical protein
MRGIKVLSARSGEPCIASEMSGSELHVVWGCLWLSRSNGILLLMCWNGAVSVRFHGSLDGGQNDCYPLFDSVGYPFSHYRILRRVILLVILLSII